MNRVIVIALLLLTAGVVRADIVATAGTISIDVSVDTTTPASTGLTAYIVTLNSPLGIYAVDGRIDATAGYLNQCWAFGGQLASPCADMLPSSGYYFLTTQQRRDDTHIIVPSSHQFTERGVQEDLVSGNSGTALCGVGEDYSQTMVIGFQDLSDYTSIPFARVVLAADAAAEFTFFISAGLRDDEARSFDFSIPSPEQRQIPEPATMSMLVLGGLALTRRRHG